jgi:hypothetical protein
MTSYFDVSISPALIKSVGGLLPLLEVAVVVDVLDVFDEFVDFDVAFPDVPELSDVLAVFPVPPPLGAFVELDPSVDVSVPLGVFDPLGDFDAGGVVPSDDLEVLSEAAFVSAVLELFVEPPDVLSLEPATVTLPAGLICTFGDAQATPGLGGTFAGMSRCCVTPYGVAS